MPVVGLNLFYELGFVCDWKQAFWQISISRRAAPRKGRSYQNLSRRLVGVYGEIGKDLAAADGPTPPPVKTLPPANSPFGPEF